MILAILVLTARASQNFRRRAVTVLALRAVCTHSLSQSSKQGWCNCALQPHPRHIHMGHGRKEQQLDQPPEEHGRVLDRGVWKEYKVLRVTSEQGLATRASTHTHHCTALRALPQDDGHACQVEGPMAPLLQPPMQDGGTKRTARPTNRGPVNVLHTRLSRLHCRSLLHVVHKFIQQVWPRPARVILVNVVINGLYSVNSISRLLHERTAYLYEIQ